MKKRGMLKVVLLLCLLLALGGCLPNGVADVTPEEGNFSVTIRVPPQFLASGDVSALSLIALDSIGLKVTREEFGVEEPFTAEQTKPITNGEVEFTFRLPVGAFFVELVGLQGDYVVLRDTESSSYWRERREMLEWDFHEFPRYVESADRFFGRHRRIDIRKDGVTIVEGETGFSMVLEPGYLRVVFAEELEPRFSDIALSQLGDQMRPRLGEPDGDSLWFYHVPIGGWVLSGTVLHGDTERSVSYPLVMEGGRVTTIALNPEVLPPIE